MFKFFCKDKKAIGSGGFYSGDSHENYSEFTANITYNSPDIPDTVQIIILIANAPKTHSGSFYILDDLSLETATGVADISNNIEYKLEQNYPNPFNPSTYFKYQLANAGFVTLKIFDILGNETTVLINEEKSAGTYTVHYDGSKLTSGVYFYELRAEGFRDIKKFTLLK